MLLTWGSIPALTPITPHPQVSITTSLGPTAGDDGVDFVHLTGCISQLENAPHPMGLERAQSCRWVGSLWKLGEQAQVYHTDHYGFHRSPVFQRGQTLSFSFSPFLEGLPMRLQSRTDTWDFCRWCNTRFTKSLLFSVSLAIHHSNSQKNIYGSGGWLFTIPFFIPTWLSHIPLHPLRKEGTEWDTSAENETLSPQKNCA